MVEKVLKLSRGLVRPVMTLTFAGAITAGFFLGLIEPMAFIGIAGPVIGFWVRDRVEANKKGEA